MGDAVDADRAQRRHRPARRRLQGRAHEAAEARDYHAFQVDIFAADAGRHGVGYHDEHGQRGRRHRAGRQGRRDALRRLLHRRDRRQAGGRHDAARGDRGCRGGDRRLAGLLHGQLRASLAFRAGACPQRGVGEPRVRGVRANASPKSHAELDESETLDIGDIRRPRPPLRRLTRSFPSMRILGGCCGTDHRHMAAICEAVMPAMARSA